MTVDFEGIDSASELAEALNEDYGLAIGSDWVDAERTNAEGWWAWVAERLVGDHGATRVWSVDGALIERSAEGRWVVTGEPLEVWRVQVLREEAGQAGDVEMVEVCERALRGDVGDLAECVRVIVAAQVRDHGGRDLP